MNETQTRAELIDPALRAAGWGVVEGSRVAREEGITLGRLQGAGTRATREVADFLLVYRGHTLGVIEAKKRAAAVTEGLSQAKRYAAKIRARFAFSTNGDGVYRADMETGVEGALPGWPTPADLWGEAFAEANAWRDRFAAVGLKDKGGLWTPRYYQRNAINAVLEAIASGERRVLLTLATGTGKTSIAAQIAWKLYESRWSLRSWPTPGDADASRRPRVLFLADRNILANQAFNEFDSFGAFPDGGLVRINPREISKKGGAPKNGSVFFTIFQTFMTGEDGEGNASPVFGDYPPDFFDFIVVDECHRGGAKDESTWRAILEYFSPAVQLGLTATPKREINADTYAYFGEPVYVYSLKEGINDGFLTPFKVVQVQTTLDEYIWTPDDDVVEGEIEQGRRYTESDFNRVIEIAARERKRVEIFMGMIDQREKTLVFCATQDHALAVRDLINQMATQKHPDYCVRVTAQDGDEGERFLRVFQDNEKTLPTVLTTSQKLSTGVDARNIRNIVLMRPINSMIEFKQIIGRGTRLYDGKDYFTIYDFVKAYEHFSDPEWDGEPVEPEPVVPAPPRPEPEPKEPTPREPPGRRERVRVKLADGKERTIQHMASTSFWSPDGTPMSATQFIERLFGDLPALFTSEAQLREIWSKPDTRRALLAGLEEKGYSREQLADVARVIDAERSDLFDVLAYIAFALPTMSREERVRGRRGMIFARYAGKQSEFLDFVLGHYIEQGVTELDDEKLPVLLVLKYHAVEDAVRELGGVPTIRDAFVGFQRYLYQPDGAA